MGDEQRAAPAEPTPAAEAKPGTGTGNTDLPASGATTTAAEAAEVGYDAELENIRFSLAKEVAYHNAREAWFGGLQRATLFVNVALGAGLLAQYIDARLAGFLVAMSSALDVTFDFAGQARRHRDLRSRYMALAEEALGPACDRNAVCTAMLRLDADSPPTYRACEAVAYNQALTGLGRDPDYRLAVPTLTRLARHFWPFGGANFITLAQQRAGAVGSTDR